MTTDVDFLLELNLQSFLKLFVIVLEISIVFEKSASVVGSMRRLVIRELIAETLHQIDVGLRADYLLLVLIVL